MASVPSAATVSHLLRQLHMAAAREAVKPALQRADGSLLYLPRCLSSCKAFMPQLYRNMSQFKKQAWVFVIFMTWEKSMWVLQKKRKVEGQRRKNKGLYASDQITCSIVASRIECDITAPSSTSDTVRKKCTHLDANAKNTPL